MSEEDDFDQMIEQLSEKLGEIDKAYDGCLEQVRKMCVEHNLDFEKAKQELALLINTQDSLRELVASLGDSSRFDNRCLQVYHGLLLATYLIMSRSDNPDYAEKALYNMTQIVSEVMQELPAQDQFEIMLLQASKLIEGDKNAIQDS